MDNDRDDNLGRFIKYDLESTVECEDQSTLCRIIVGSNLLTSDLLSV